MGAKEAVGSSGAIMVEVESAWEAESAAVMMEVESSWEAESAAVMMEVEIRAAVDCS